MGYTRLNDEQKEIIRNEYLKIPIRELARMFRTTRTPIKNYLKQNGLIIPDEVKAQRKDHSSYKTGNVPFNKGKRGFYAAGAEKGWFKKGHLPHNHIPGIGHIKLRQKRDGSEKYFYIKIAEAKWIQLHRKVWMDNYGEIPRGMLVTFLDGNVENCQIENLVLISMKENRIRNSGHVLLNDTYVAGLMAHEGHVINIDLREKLLENKALIDLKRNQIKLKRQCQTNQ